ncbi:MAG: hypothetical protein ACKVOW_09840 [Chitinophagaceae bacterium]
MNDRLTVRGMILLAGILLLRSSSMSQELYVFTEPASNMPAKSITAKYSLKLLDGYHSKKTEQRHAPEIMIGINKKWMLHLATSFSDMYSSNVRWESARLYAKYRFLSFDEVHKHFRMAFFAQGSLSRNNPFYDELSLEGDQPGFQIGVIATQLINKIAVSASFSNVQVLQQSRWNKDYPQVYPFQAIDYSLSAGYLLLPRSYTNYKQTNLNLYIELLGQRTYDLAHYFADIAPSIQLIFNSNSKLNIGYRVQLGGDMHRMATKSWMISFERTFLNALNR